MIREMTLESGRGRDGGESLLVLSEFPGLVFSQETCKSQWSTRQGLFP